ncbi:MAG: HlyD family secretion protein [Bacteroidota bacterium]
MSRKVIIPVVLVVAIATAYLLFGRSTNAESGNLLINVQSGEFIVDINTTGELEAKNSVKILGPSAMRRYQIYEVPLQHIIDEGKVVKKGDYVAKLDESPVNTKIQDVEIEIQQAQSKYTQTKLDTTLQMRESRDKLINLNYDVIQKELEYEQSEYEPPAVIKKKEIELEKAKRAYSQAKENLEIKKQQNIAKMQEVSAELRKKQLRLEGLNELRSQFQIIAPEDGMLIYYTRWGQTTKAGSQISTWDPIVATLPDLSTMLSNTYVNEVDIRNVKKGQKVEIGLDAFPEKKLTGVVTSVANVGEQRKNSDAKVFLVNVEVNEVDESLRPAMTTSNKIIIERFKDVTYVPLECLHSQGDTITYVYRSAGFGVQKQEVKVGAANATDVIIEEGLSQNDQLYMSVVESVKDAEVKRLNANISQLNK